MGDADASGGAVAQIEISPSQPVVLYAVDGQDIPGVQVSSELKAYVYALSPGSHVLWLSSVASGNIPLLPRHIKCFVMEVSLTAGAKYELHYDRKRKLGVLSHSDAPEVLGRLVDEPLIPKRWCNWQ